MHFVARRISAKCDKWRRRAQVKAKAKQKAESQKPKAESGAKARPSEQFCGGRAEWFG